MNTAAHLDDVATKQLLFKPGAFRDVVAAILVHYLRDRIAWSDAVDLSFVGDADKNCIGSAWKQLKKLGILAPMGQFKRSAKESSRGRTIFKWRMANEGLANALLKANGVNAAEFNPHEPQLPLQ